MVINYKFCKKKHFIQPPEELREHPMVIIYKFCKKNIFMKPPGEPREHHLGEVRQKKFKLQVQKFRKIQMTGTVWRIFEKKLK